MKFARHRTAVSMRRDRQRYLNDTEARFRMLVLVTLVMQELGVRYNQKFMAGDFDARDSGNLLLHGILTGRGGTCVTMPVLYAAIGRRLGYPLFLCYSNAHVFLRWEQPAERFNMDATAWGFLEESDEYFRNFVCPLRKSDTTRGYLTNLTPRQELACLLAQRGRCLLDHLRFAESAKHFMQVHCGSSPGSSETS
ncbi:MAG: transglutaminase family protein [Planctomycetaceae bacterium]